MNNAHPLERSLCERYCVYYKPGKNEELACRGYVVVEQLLHRKTIIVPDAGGRSFDLNKAELLMQRLCASCDFRENDCDFTTDRAASPCGGFLLLAQLIERGAIAVDNIPS